MARLEAGGRQAGGLPEPTSGWSDPDLARRLEELRLQYRVPGLAALVMDRDGPERVTCAGVADLTTERPVTPSTPFAWYSLTKPVTAAVVLQLVERGLLDLGQPVLDILPELRFGPMRTRREQSRARAVTPGGLLGHDVGLRDRQFHAARWFREADGAWPPPRRALERALARSGRLRGAPGRRAHYSNLGYAVLGEVVAEVSGAPFREHVREAFLAPLGMRATTFDPTDVPAGPAWTPPATGYVRRRSGMGLALGALRTFRLERAGPFDRVARHLLVFSPHGGLWGPVADLAVFLRSRLGDGEGNRRALRGGRGWNVGGVPPRTLSHGGRGPGFTAEMLIDVPAGRAVAVLGNATFDAAAVAAELRRSAGGGSS